MPCHPSSEQKLWISSFKVFVQSSYNFSSYLMVWMEEGKIIATYCAPIICQTTVLRVFRGIISNPDEKPSWVVEDANTVFLQMRKWRLPVVEYLASINS